jgi:hypothetical protein
MTTNFVSSGLAVRFVLAIAMGLSLGSVVHLHASVVELMAVPDDTHSSDSGAQATDRSGVCEREAEKLLGQKAVRIGRSTRAPKKLRHVPPNYPELPPGTQASGVWLGEILIDNSGKVARVWALREVRFEPPFPAFNNGIKAAIQQWEYQALLVKGKTTSACMTVAINVDWH